MPRFLTLRSRVGEHRVEIADGRVTVDGALVDPPSRAWAAADGDRRWVFLSGELYEFEVLRSGRRRPRSHHASLTAPMPATVVRINTPAGTEVKRGDTLVVLEAMKMELPVRADVDGRIAAVNCQVGQLVQPGVSLIEME